MLGVWRLQEPTMRAASKTSEISELRRTAKWRADDFLTGQELKLFQSVVARMCQNTNKHRSFPWGGNHELDNSDNYRFFFGKTINFFATTVTGLNVLRE